MKCSWDHLTLQSLGRNNKGQNIAGVQEAARGIFGVDAKDVTLPQAAYIAGWYLKDLTFFILARVLPKLLLGR